MGKIKEFVASLKFSVENELSKLLITNDESIAKDNRLKARLQDLLLFESLLQSPEKLKRQLESQLANIKPKV